MAERPASELDRVLPVWHFRELHSARVAASPEHVFAAVRDVTAAEMPLARFLMRLRGLRVGTSRPLLEDALGFFSIVVEEPERELVLAAVGQPWRLGGGDRPDTAFGSFAAPGYAKLALAFRLDGDRLSTETRVLLTDARSHRAFRRYWIVVRPFSGLIRRLWLRAIRRRAEAAGRCSARRRSP